MFIRFSKRTNFSLLLLARIIIFISINKRHFYFPVAQHLMQLKPAAQDRLTRKSAGVGQLIVLPPMSPTCSCWRKA
jgi:hypothetical protein